MLLPLAVITMNLPECQGKDLRFYLEAPVEDMHHCLVDGEEYIFH
jgi:hypothetical protein